MKPTDREHQRPDWEEVAASAGFKDLLAVKRLDGPNSVGMARHLFQARPWFPLENPGIVSVPLGFLATFLGTVVSAEPAAEAKFSELTVRVHTGLGAEKAEVHSGPLNKTLRG
jgi:hypothetical protein